MEPALASVGFIANETMSTAKAVRRRGERRKSTLVQASGGPLRHPRISCEDAIDMASAISTRFPQLLPETLQAKAGHITVGGCLLLGGVAAVAASWDEVNCVAGEYSSSGPCGIGIVVASQVLFVALIAVVAGAIILTRGLRRPVDPKGGTGWRLGPGFLVIASGMLLGLMLPRHECPAGYTLSPVFRFCVSAERSFPAPSPGAPYKVGAFAVGLVVGLLLLFWRRAPWWLPPAVAIVAFVGTVGYTLHRSVGLPV
jgi:hypothetical protein